MKILGDWFNEADGVTADLGRAMWAAGVVTFIGLSVYVYVWKAQPFEPVNWGGGLAAVLAAGGGMIWMKDKEKDPGHPDSHR